MRYQTVAKRFVAAYSPIFRGILTQTSTIDFDRVCLLQVFPEPWLMPRLFTAEIASFYEDFLSAKGIKLLKGKTAKAFEGEGGKVSWRIALCHPCLGLQRGTVGPPCCDQAAGIGRECLGGTVYMPAGGK